MPVLVDGLAVTEQGACGPIANPAGSLSAPNDVNAAASASMATARVVAANAYSDSPPFPLTHPRILYANLLAGASTTQPQLLTPSTWDRWQFSSSVDLIITLPANQTIDTVALGACQFEGRSTLIEYDATTSGTFEPFAPAQFNSGSAMMFFREHLSVRRLRITITGGGVGSLGVVSAGLSLQMQRPIYGGVNPITLNRVTDYFNNQSESGNWLGRQIRKRGLESSLSFERLTAPWYRQYFDPFAQSARELPFFFAWRPADYPAEVAYCWTEADAQPSNTGGGNNYISVSLSVKAHA